MFVQGKVGVLSVLQIHHHGYDGFNGLIVHDHLHYLIDHQIFQPLLAHRLFLAVRPLLFYGHAFVVVVNGSVPALAALAAEVGTTVAAEQFGGQQIIVLSLVTGRGFFVLLDFLLHPVKEFLGDNSRNTIWNQNVPILVFSNVSTILQHMLDAVVVQRLPQLVADNVLIQPVPQLLHGGTFIISLEYFQYKRSGQRINLKMLFLINNKTNGERAAVIHTF